MAERTAAELPASQTPGTENQEQTHEKHSLLVSIEEYGQFIGEETVEGIMGKSQRLHGMRVVHVSSTFYGGVVLYRSPAHPDR